MTRAEHLEYWMIASGATAIVSLVLMGVLL